eukprot:gene7875-10655_t
MKHFPGYPNLLYLIYFTYLSKPPTSDALYSHWVGNNKELSSLALSAALGLHPLHHVHHAGHVHPSGPRVRSATTSARQQALEEGHGVHALLLRGLARDPRQRHASAQAFRDELKTWLRPVTTPMAET